MKKRLISYLCLLCATVLLLSSCAAGLPGHELFSAIGDGVGDFSSNVKNLLQKNKPIIIDGKSNYTVIYSGTESDTVKQAITDLCATVEEATGVALPVNQKFGFSHRILIGNTGDPASTTGSTELCAADFYIGFVDEDLVIQAKNDLMLCSALHYLKTEFLQGDNANVGEGYFYLPNAFSMTSPTVVIQKEDVKDYTVVYSENASLWERETLIPSFYQQMTKASGLSLGFKSDLIEIVDEEGTKEILVGAPNRKQAQEILATLDFDEYYIGKEGNKIMILAHNSYMLEVALSLFSESFLKPDGVHVDQSVKIMTLPGILSYRGGHAHTLLASDGKPKAALVYADSLGEAVRPYIDAFAIYFEKLTNTPLPVYNDRVGDADTDGLVEILVGPTIRQQSTALSRGMSADEWKLLVDGGAVLVAAVDDNATVVALQTLQEQLYSFVDRFTDEEIYGWTDQGWTILPETDRLLAIPDDYKQSGITPPSPVSMTNRIELADGSYALYAENSSEQNFNSYIASLINLEYVELQQKKEGSLSTLVMANAFYVVTVSYASDTKLLRAIVDPNPLMAPSTSISTSLTGRNNITPFYAQLYGTSTNIYNHSIYGMCTVLRLRDGSFVVIDGGNGDKSNARELLDFLKASNPLSDKPVISCWILMSGAAPSYQTFSAFSQYYATEVRLNSVMHNFPTRAQTLLHAGNTVAKAQANLQMYVNRFGSGVKIYHARTGTTFAFAGCRIDILQTLEDFPAGYALENYADCSLVLRLTLLDTASNQKTFMMLGNISRTGATLLMNRYGEALKSDAVQIPTQSGHIKGSAHEELYDMIAAPVVFWPVAYKNASKDTLYYGKATWDSTVRGMLKKSYAKSCFVACRGNVTLTLSEMDAAIAGTPKAPGLTAAEAAVGTTIS